MQKYFRDQEVPGDEQGLCTGDGLMVASADNIGCQKTVQKFCEADNKLSIKIEIASCSNLLDTGDTTQHHPMAYPQLWYYNNRYESDPTVLTDAEHMHGALVSESNRHVNWFMEEAANIIDRNGGADPAHGLAVISSQEKADGTQYCHNCKQHMPSGKCCSICKSKFADSKKSAAGSVYVKLEPKQPAQPEPIVIPDGSVEFTDQTAKHQKKRPKMMDMPGQIKFYIATPSTEF